MGLIQRCVSFFLMALVLVVVSTAMAAGPQDIGVVILHGKGGSPDTLAAPLDTALKEQGMQVRSLNMPWSSNANTMESQCRAEQVA